MAQHDYSIANQGFPAFRSDLNDALAAIVSNNSGATEPTTMFAHQMWVDTAANPSILKIRNADNDAWITIGSIDQTGDTFTLVNLRTSGPVVFNDAGADVDFRVESDTDANAFFVDGANGNIGLGEGTPTEKLFLRDGAFTIASGGVTSLFTHASLTAVYGTTSNHPVRFSTNNTERARITSGGYFKASDNGTYVGVTGPYHEFRRTSSGTSLVISNSNADPYGVDIALSSAIPDNTTNYFLYCNDSFNVKAIIYSDGSFQSRTNSYGGISDVKLKQDIVDANSQWDDIKGLRVRKFRMKDGVAADPNYPAHLGLIAQEAELVSPGLVFESPDMEEVEVPVLDDGGNPVLDEERNPQVTKERQATGEVTKSVKYSVLYMKAVKALQEAMERIETLEANNTTLEARLAALEANNGG
jgi:hypothetical protein